MKKIIIVNNNLKTGGVQVSLLNLLKEIGNLYDVTVLLFYAKKESIEKIPPSIKVVVVKSPFKYLGMSSSDTKNSPFKFVIRSFWVCITKLFGRSIAISLMSKFQSTIKGYDFAISYLHEGSKKTFYGGCNEFVLRNIKAQKKMTWVHCDFKLCGADNKQSKRIYSLFNTIVACSEGTKAAFVNCLPELEKKCVVVRNCNDYEKIRRLAGEGIQYNKAYFNIVTVARLAREKGIERALMAIRHCIEKGYKVHYHIVGWGMQFEYLNKLVDEYHLTNVVTFYGSQDNPYPYMKSADLFLLPSYHEAAPMVFDEAACLGVPVLATKTTSTDEMIIKNGAGFVCENSQEGIISGLCEILRDTAVLNRIRENLQQKHFSNQSSIDSLIREVLL